MKMLKMHFKKLWNKNTKKNMKKFPRFNFKIIKNRLKNKFKFKKINNIVCFCKKAEEYEKSK